MDSVCLPVCLFSTVAVAWEPARFGATVGSPTLDCGAGAGTWAIPTQIEAFNGDSVGWHLEANVSRSWSSLVLDEWGIPFEADCGGPDGLGQLACLAMPAMEAHEFVSVSLLLQHQDSPADVEGGWLTVSLQMVHEEGWKTSAGKYYFRVIDGKLVASDHSTYAQTRLVDGPDGEPSHPAIGGIQEAPEALKHLPPWDNPYVSDSWQELMESGETAENPGPQSVVLPGGSSGGNASSTNPFLLVAVLIGLGCVAGLASNRLRLLATIAAVAVPLNAAQAVTHSVYGYSSFWDARVTFSGTGARRPPCDVENTTCTPATGTCCFKGIPRAQIELYACSPLNCYTVETDETDSYGFFLLSDPNWSSTNDYWLRLTFYRDGYPAQTALVADWEEDPEVVWSAEIDMSGTYNFIPNWNINPAEDETSDEGAWGAIWRTLHDAAMVAEVEGETRHRKVEGSQNDYDLITARWDVTLPSGTACTGSTSYLTLPADEGRNGLCPLHEFGHLLSLRTVDDWLDVTGHVAWFFRSEGVAVSEAFAEFYVRLGMWDPDDALGATIRSYYSGCSDTSSTSNTNDVAWLNNSMWALWHMIDTSTDDADGNGDLVDITLEDMMDGFYAWQTTSGSQGDNKTNNEFYLVAVAQSQCTTNEHCDPGQVCHPDHNECRYGDPHGENIYDWVYYMADVTGGSIRNFSYTLESAICIGSADNTYTFDGGYHTD